jgi:hypothetical protein
MLAPMKNRLLLIALLVASIFCAAFAYQSERRAQRWEYKIEKDADEKRLNQLGAEGWELVTLDRGSGSLSRSMFVLKRPAQ